MFVSPRRNHSNSWMIDFVMQLLGSQQRKAGAEVETQLRSENRRDPCASAVAFGHTLVEDSLEKIEIISHDDSVLRREAAILEGLDQLPVHMPGRMAKQRQHQLSPSRPDSNPNARNSAIVKAHASKGQGLSLTARTEEIIAVTKSTSRSSSSGTETTVIEKITKAMTPPTRLPTRMKASPLVSTSPPGGNRPDPACGRRRTSGRGRTNNRSTR